MIAFLRPISDEKIMTFEHTLQNKWESMIEVVPGATATFVFAISSQFIVLRRTSTELSQSGVVPRLSAWRLVTRTSAAHTFLLPRDVGTAP